MITFMMHFGRMSCLQAAGTLQSQPRHRAQVSRFLARPRWRAQKINGQLREAVLQLETASGIRIPFQRPHYTKEYCKKKGLTHRTTAESAADMIRELPLPEAAEVIVLGDTADDVKILMTNNLRMSVREVVELYSVRWQIELFFKELKSTLGFHQYQFQNFEAVEGWVELALATVLYLEWYRAQQLARRGLSEREKEWWRRQRTHGLCQAMRQASEQAELKYIADRLETPGGIRKLRRLIRNSFAPEYQTTA